MPSTLLAGATGLVGRACLDLLVEDDAFERVVVITRRTLEGARSTKLEAHVVDFDHLDDHAALFRVDQIVCALGTTIKQAGSRERFRAVDFGYALKVAQLGLEQGARHFLLVSSLGADRRSRVFYSQVKGELETAVSALAYRSVSIVRPSLLLGERAEFRLGETVAKRFGFLAPGKYKPIHARDVAAALVRLAREDQPGRRIVESAEMRAWAQEPPGANRVPVS
jgi:uncharacterized protein YbjT (DUF2867 family)